MASRTAAQEEFDDIFARASAPDLSLHHPADKADYHHDQAPSDDDEQAEYAQQRVDENMRLPTYDRGVAPLHLPHQDFDNGRSTGVKGVIADARSYEEARRSGSWRTRFTRGNSGSKPRPEKRASSATFRRDEGERSASDEDEAFVERWRQARREELMKEGNDIRNRRTSPSVRRYGRFDEVDALGYLDAIEKVTRDTVVVVFVYDPESAVSEVISDALAPLVPANPTVHFVRVQAEDIEFDKAAVPAILAYKNQGDLFANLTYLIGQIPDDTLFDTAALETILRKHQVL